MNSQENLAPQEKDVQLLADQLDQLQKQLEPEVGIPVVERIIECLRANKFAAAKNVCTIDGDKLHSYPIIKQWLIDNLFEKDEQNPWEWQPTINL